MFQLGPGGRGGVGGSSRKHTHCFPTGPRLGILVCTKANILIHLLASIHRHIFILNYDGPVFHLIFSFYLSLTHSYLDTVSSEEQALIFFFLSNIPLLSKL